MAENNANPAGTTGDPKHLRLTLRTLLAYLDDALDPEPAREIGAKIQETPYASQLVDRIQEVLRRRRVTAPDLKGPGSGLDPNTVAEYLDNTLPPQAVSDVERVCLESDAHLAEVAACHQILTLVLGDPIHVSAESRDRLHALIPAALAQKSPQRKKTSPAPEQTAAAQVAPALRQAAAMPESQPARRAVEPSSNGGDRAGQSAPAKFSASIPDYLKPKPLWKRALVPTLVVLVLVFWLGLFVFDPSLTGNGSNKNDEVARTDTKTSTLTEPEAVPNQENSTPDTKTAGQTPAVANNPPAKTPETNIVIDENPPDDKTNGEVIASTAPPVPAAKPPEPGNSDPTTVPDPGETPVRKPVDPKTNPAAEPPVTARQVLYTTKTANPIAPGMLLRFDAEEKEWGTLPQRTNVFLGEQLACPVPLDATFKIGKTDCEVTFIGGVLASFEAAKPPADMALKLSQGTCIFSRTGGQEDPVNLAIHVGDDVLQLELSDPASRCAIEIVPQLPNQFEKGLGPNWYTGTLWVQAGQVRFTNWAKTKHLMAPNQILDLTPHHVAEGEQQPPPAMVQAEQVLPEWLDPAGRKFTKLKENYVRQLYRSFFEADIETDVTLVLLPLAKDIETHPPLAVMAAKTLAMTGCLRDVADLMSLSEATPEELRLATIDGTRRWLTLHHGKADQAKLQEELRRNFQKDTADRIYRLLWGYQKSDLKVQAEALELVGQLDHSNITIRTLAYLHLHELTGQTNNYRPLDTESQRRTAVDRWRNDVTEGKIFD